MPLSKSPGAYVDCRAYLDQALEKEKGIRVTCDTPGQAINLRQRMYKAAQLERKQNMDTFPVGDPQHGRSAYDGLSISVDRNFVLVRKHGASDLKVEEL